MQAEHTGNDDIESTSVEESDSQYVFEGDHDVDHRDNSTSGTLAKTDVATGASSTDDDSSDAVTDDEFALSSAVVCGQEAGARPGNRERTSGLKQTVPVKAIDKAFVQLGRLASTIHNREDFRNSECCKRCLA